MRFASPQANLSTVRNCQRLANRVKKSKKQTPKTKINETTHNEEIMPNEMPTVVTSEDSPVSISQTMDPIESDPVSVAKGRVKYNYPLYTHVNSDTYYKFIRKTQ